MKLKQLLLTCLVICLALSAPRAVGQLGESEFLPPDQAFRVEATAEAADRVRVDFLVTPGYYLYRHRMSFKLDEAAGATPATLGAAAIPEGEWKEDEFFGRQQVFHESVSVTIPVSRAPGAALELPLVVGLQGCAEKGLCYPPEIAVSRCCYPPLPRAVVRPRALRPQVARHQATRRPAAQAARAARSPSSRSRTGSRR